MARGFLEDVGWDVERVDEAPRSIEREDFRDDPEACERFDQAALDGIVVTLHTWPVGASEEE